ncbi:MAG: GAF domain-containing sensor histidine kinase [Anaerolineae bacterium]|nr:GAF domain-containing sensor histidine kinase [Anaerolineae bacterium]
MNSDKYPEPDEPSVLNRLREIAEAVMYAAEGESEEQVLERIAHVSREIVKARYAALGVPDGRGGLRYFKVSGMTTDEIRPINHLPLGRGLLGVIMRDREVLRMEHMQDDPRSVGFCSGHPIMDSLLGVPIQVGPQLLGILYLSDREDGQPFSEEDQWLIETLAGYAALAIAGAQLREQQSRVSTLEERERIGMELHDGVIQSLYAVGMHLDLMRFSGNARSDDLGEIIGQLNTVIEDIRRYILNLKATHTGTISERFREMLGRLYIPTALEVEVNAPDEPPPFTASTFESICQIANEAISNAVRHADATCLKISTVYDQQRFQIMIVDDGKGFDLEAVRDQSGLGLRNMQQRARLHGGHVSIQSVPGQGTTLTITIPVSAR